MPTMAARIEYIITLRKLSQSDVAIGAGVTRGTVSNWIRGRSTAIEAGTLLTLARFLKVSPTWIVDGKGEMEALSPEMTEEAAEYQMLYNEMDDEQRDMLKGMIRGLWHYANQGRSSGEGSETPDNAPGSRVLAEVFEMLREPKFKARFDKLPSDKQGKLVAATARRLEVMSEEAMDGEVAGYLSNVIEFMQADI